MEQQPGNSVHEGRREPHVFIAEAQGVPEPRHVVGDGCCHPGDGAETRSNGCRESGCAPRGQHQKRCEEQTLWTDEHGCTEREPCCDWPASQKTLDCHDEEQCGERLGEEFL